MPTSLNYDWKYVEQLLTKLFEIQWSAEWPNEYFVWLNDIRDYFLYLALDSMEDRTLGEEVMQLYEKIALWIDARVEQSTTRAERESLSMWRGFFFSIRSLLLRKHEIRRIIPQKEASFTKGLPHERVSRAEWQESWETTREKLEL